MPGDKKQKKSLNLNFFYVIDKFNAIWVTRIKMEGKMKKIIIMYVLIMLCWQFSLTQQEKTGVRGDPAAVAEAKAMVETMGGMIIAVYENGITRYEMISLKGSDQVPDLSLFKAPAEFVKKNDGK